MIDIFKNIAYIVWWGKGLVIVNATRWGKM